MGGSQVVAAVKINIPFKSFDFDLTSFFLFIFSCYSVL